MKIALIGYGKMGRTIEGIAENRGHSIESIIDPFQGVPISHEVIETCDVAIEFTRPESALINILTCIEIGVPIVSGTTGWLNHLPEVKQKLRDYPESAFFYASNYSIGVNVFFELNRKLAAMMNPLPEYDVRMKEVHHTQKLDAPSGTGITLAEGILSEIQRKQKWINSEALHPDEISLISERTDDTPGTHHVIYESEVDSLEIIHTAHSRKGFALGAVLAAEWSLGKRGFLTMKQMLGF